MTAIPAMNLPSATMSAEEIYEQGYFHPVNPPDSLEVLNGGIDDANFAPGMKIPGWAVNVGAFATGYYHGFDRTDFIYAKQIAGAGVATGGDAEKERVIHAAWSSRVFVPYHASCLLWHFQGFCRQDATFWRPGGLSPDQIEYWDVRVAVDHTAEQGAYVQLPHGRSEATAPSASISEDLQNEERMRFISRIGAVGPIIPGYHQIVVSIWGKVYNPDPRTAKISVASGGIGLLAFR